MHSEFPQSEGFSRANMKPLDLCLVVGMFLTGFNRVLNEKMRFGKVVCFREKSKVYESMI